VKEGRDLRVAPFFFCPQLQKQPPRTWWGSPRPGHDSKSSTYVPFRVGHELMHSPADGRQPTNVPRGGGRGIDGTSCPQKHAPVSREPSSGQRESGARNVERWSAHELLHSPADGRHPTNVDAVVADSSRAIASPSPPALAHEMSALKEKAKGSARRLRTRIIESV
jgi:hypothetical protein